MGESIAEKAKQNTASKGRILFILATYIAGNIGNKDTNLYMSGAPGEKLVLENVKNLYISLERLGMAQKKAKFYGRELRAIQRRNMKRNLRKILLRFLNGKCPNNC